MTKILRLVTFLVTFVLVTCITVPPVWPKNYQNKPKNFVYQSIGRIRQNEKRFPEFRGRTTTPSSSTLKSQGEWIPISGRISPYVNVKVPFSPVLSRIKESPKYNPGKQYYIHEEPSKFPEVSPVESTYNSPVSNHEIPKNISTKPIYPGEGQWAKPGLKHKPHISTSNPQVQDETKNDSIKPQITPEGYDIFERGQDLFENTQVKFGKNLARLKVKRPQESWEKNIFESTTPVLEKEEKYLDPDIFDIHVVLPKHKKEPMKYIPEKKVVRDDLDDIFGGAGSDKFETIEKEKHFIPQKIYSQVRKTESKKHLPRSQIDREKEENADRLREIVKDSKIQTVYTEEGYEDSAYDHGGKEKKASLQQGHIKKEGDHESSKGQKQTKGQTSYNQKNGQLHGQTKSRGNLRNNQFSKFQNHDTRQNYENAKKNIEKEISDSEVGETITKRSQFVTPKRTIVTPRTPMHKSKIEVKTTTLSGDDINMEIHTEVKFVDGSDRRKQKFVKIVPSYKKLVESLWPGHFEDEKESEELANDKDKRETKNQQENLEEVMDPHNDRIKRGIEEVQRSNKNNHDDRVQQATKNPAEFFKQVSKNVKNLPEVQVPFTIGTKEIEKPKKVTFPEKAIGITNGTDISINLSGTHQDFSKNLVKRYDFPSLHNRYYKISEFERYPPERVANIHSLLQIKKGQMVSGKYGELRIQPMESKENKITISSESVSSESTEKTNSHMKTNGKMAKTVLQKSPTKKPKMKVKNFPNQPVLLGTSERSFTSFRIDSNKPPLPEISIKSRIDYDSLKEYEKIPKIAVTSQTHSSSSKIGFSGSQMKPTDKDFRKKTPTNKDISSKNILPEFFEEIILAPERKKRSLSRQRFHKGRPKSSYYWKKKKFSSKTKTVFVNAPVIKIRTKRGLVPEVPEVPFPNLKEIHQSPIKKASKTEKKYPFYNLDTKVLHENSPLRYAEDLDNIPPKAVDDLAFYNSRSGLKCPDIPEEVDPIPGRIKGIRSNDDVTENPGNEETGPRLQNLGDKIDCLKIKYFGEDPLDSPIFKEKVVKVPTPRIFKKSKKASQQKGNSKPKRSPKPSLPIVVEEESTNTTLNPIAIQEGAVLRPPYTFAELSNKIYNNKSRSSSLYDQINQLRRAPIQNEAFPEEPEGPSNNNFYQKSPIQPKKNLPGIDGFLIVYDDTSAEKLPQEKLLNVQSEETEDPRIQNDDITNVQLINEELSSTFPAENLQNPNDDNDLDDYGNPLDVLIQSDSVEENDGKEPLENNDYNYKNLENKNPQVGVGFQMVPDLQSGKEGSKSDPNSPKSSLEHDSRKLEHNIGNSNSFQDDLIDSNVTNSGNRYIENEFREPEHRLKVPEQDYKNIEYDYNIPASQEIKENVTQADLLIPDELLIGSNGSLPTQEALRDYRYFSQLVPQFKPGMRDSFKVQEPNFSTTIFDITKYLPQIKNHKSVTSEVQYKDEIKPSEQLNVYSDVLRAINISTQESGNSAEPLQPITVKLQISNSTKFRIPKRKIRIRPTTRSPIGNLLTYDSTPGSTNLVKNTTFLSNSSMDQVSPQIFPTEKPTRQKGLPEKTKAMINKYVLSNPLLIKVPEESTEISGLAPPPISIDNKYRTIIEVPKTVPKNLLRPNLNYFYVTGMRPPSKKVYLNYNQPTRRTRRNVDQIVLRSEGNIAEPHQKARIINRAISTIKITPKIIEDENTTLTPIIFQDASKILWQNFFPNKNIEVQSLGNGKQTKSSGKHPSLKEADPKTTSVDTWKLMTSKNIGLVPKIRENELPMKLEDSSKNPQKMTSGNNYWHKITTREVPKKILIDSGINKGNISRKVPKNYNRGDKVSSTNQSFEKNRKNSIQERLLLDFTSEEDSVDELFTRTQWQKTFPTEDYKNISKHQYKNLGSHDQSYKFSAEKQPPKKIPEEEPLEYGSKLLHTEEIINMGTPGTFLETRNLSIQDLSVPEPNYSSKPDSKSKLNRFKNQKNYFFVQKYPLRNSSEPTLNDNYMVPIPGILEDLKNKAFKKISKNSKLQSGSPKDLIEVINNDSGDKSSKDIPNSFQENSGETNVNNFGKKYSLQNLLDLKNQDSKEISNPELQIGSYFPGKNPSLKNPLEPEPTDSRSQLKNNFKNLNSKNILNPELQSGSYFPWKNPSLKNPLVPEPNNFASQLNNNFMNRDSKEISFPGLQIGTFSSERNRSLKNLLVPIPNYFTDQSNNNFIDSKEFSTLGFHGGSGVPGLNPFKKLSVQNKSNEEKNKDFNNIWRSSGNPGSQTSFPENYFHEDIPIQKIFDSDSKELDFQKFVKSKLQKGPNDKISNFSLKYPAGDNGSIEKLLRDYLIYLQMGPSPQPEKKHNDRPADNSSDLKNFREPNNGPKGGQKRVFRLTMWFERPEQIKLHASFDRNFKSINSTNNSSVEVFLEDHPKILDHFSRNFPNSFNVNSTKSIPERTQSDPRIIPDDFPEAAFAISNQGINENNTSIEPQNIENFFKKTVPGRTQNVLELIPEIFSRNFTNINEESHKNFFPIKLPQVKSLPGRTQNIFQTTTGFPEVSNVPKTTSILDRPPDASGSTHSFQGRTFNFRGRTYNVPGQNEKPNNPETHKYFPDSTAQIFQTPISTNVPQTTDRFKILSKNPKNLVPGRTQIINDPIIFSDVFLGSSTTANEIYLNNFTPAFLGARVEVDNSINTIPGETQVVTEYTGRTQDLPEDFEGSSSNIYVILGNQQRPLFKILNEYPNITFVIDSEELGIASEEESNVTATSGHDLDISKESGEIESKNVAKKLDPDVFSVILPKDLRSNPKELFPNQTSSRSVTKKFVDSTEFRGNNNQKLNHRNNPFKNFPVKVKLNVKFPLNFLQNSVETTFKRKPPKGTKSPVEFINLNDFYGTQKSIKSNHKKTQLAQNLLVTQKSPKRPSNMTQKHPQRFQNYKNLNQNSLNQIFENINNNSKNLNSIPKMNRSMNMNHSSLDINHSPYMNRNNVTMNQSQNMNHSINSSQSPTMNHSPNMNNSLNFKHSINLNLNFLNMNHSLNLNHSINMNHSPNTNHPPNKNHSPITNHSPKTNHFPNMNHSPNKNHSPNTNDSPNKNHSPNLTQNTKDTKKPPNFTENFIEMSQTPPKLIHNPLEMSQKPPKQIQYSIKLSEKLSDIFQNSETPTPYKKIQNPQVIQNIFINWIQNPTKMQTSKENLQNCRDKIQNSQEMPGSLQERFQESPICNKNHQETLEEISQEPLPLIQKSPETQGATENILKEPNQVPERHFGSFFRKPIHFQHILGATQKPLVREPFEIEESNAKILEDILEMNQETSLSNKKSSGRFQNIRNLTQIVEKEPIKIPEPYLGSFFRSPVYFKYILGENARPLVREPPETRTTNTKNLKTNWSQDPQRTKKYPKLTPKTVDKSQKHLSSIHNSQERNIESPNIVRISLKTQKLSVRIQDPSDLNKKSYWIQNFLKRAERTQREAQIFLESLQDPSKINSESSGREPLKIDSSNPKVVIYENPIESNPNGEDSSNTPTQKLLDIEPKGSKPDSDEYTEIVTIKPTSEKYLAKIDGVRYVNFVPKTTTKKPSSVGRYTTEDSSTANPNIMGTHLQHKSLKKINPNYTNPSESKELLSVLPEDQITIFIPEMSPKKINIQYPEPDSNQTTTPGRIQRFTSKSIILDVQKSPKKPNPNYSESSEEKFEDVYRHQDLEFSPIPHPIKRPNLNYSEAKKINFEISQNKSNLVNSLPGMSQRSFKKPNQHYLKTSEENFEDLRKSIILRRNKAHEAFEIPKKSIKKPNLNYTDSSFEGIGSPPEVLMEALQSTSVPGFSNVLFKKPQKEKTFQEDYFQEVLRSRKPTNFPKQTIPDISLLNSNKNYDKLSVEMLKKIHHQLNGVGRNKRFIFSGLPGTRKTGLGDIRYDLTTEPIAKIEDFVNVVARRKRSLQTIRSEEFEGTTDYLSAKYQKTILKTEELKKGAKKIPPEVIGSGNFRGEDVKYSKRAVNRPGVTQLKIPDPKAFDNLSVNPKSPEAISSTIASRKANPKMILRTKRFLKYKHDDFAMTPRGTTWGNFNSRVSRIKSEPEGGISRVPRVARSPKKPMYTEIVRSRTPPKTDEPEEFEPEDLLPKKRTYQLRARTTTTTEEAPEEAPEEDDYYEVEVVQVEAPIQRPVGLPDYIKLIDKLRDYRVEHNITTTLPEQETTTANPRLTTKGTTKAPKSSTPSLGSGEIPAFLQVVDKLHKRTTTPKEDLDFEVDDVPLGPVQNSNPYLASPLRSHSTTEEPSESFDEDPETHVRNLRNKLQITIGESKKYKTIERPMLRHSLSSRYNSEETKLPLERMFTTKEPAFSTTVRNQEKELVLQREHAPNLTEPPEMETTTFVRMKGTRRRTRPSKSRTTTPSTSTEGTTKAVVRRRRPQKPSTSSTSTTKSPLENSTNKLRRRRPTTQTSTPLESEKDIVSESPPNYSTNPKGTTTPKPEHSANQKRRRPSTQPITPLDQQSSIKSYVSEIPPNHKKEYTPVTEVNKNLPKFQKDNISKSTWRRLLDRIALLNIEGFQGDFEQNEDLNSPKDDVEIFSEIQNPSMKHGGNYRYENGARILSIRNRIGLKRRPTIATESNNPQKTFEEPDNQPELSVEALDDENQSTQSTARSTNRFRIGTKKSPSLSQSQIRELSPVENKSLNSDKSLLESTVHASSMTPVSKKINFFTPRMRHPLKITKATYTTTVPTIPDAYEIRNQQIPILVRSNLNWEVTPQNNIAPKIEHSTSGITTSTKMERITENNDEIFMEYPENDPKDLLEDPGSLTTMSKNADFLQDSNEGFVPIRGPVSYQVSLKKRPPNIPENSANSEEYSEVAQDSIARPKIIKDPSKRMYFYARV